MKLANKFIEESLLWHYAFQLIQRLSYLQYKNIIHRDIKCLNMLLNKHNRLKIGDYSVSTIWSRAANLTFLGCFGCISVFLDEDERKK